jgi:Fe2+ or Zn2+ uptake regulation protein
VKLLREIGMVRAIDLGEAHRHYEVKQDDHVHLVCSDCGRITDIPSPVSFRKLAGSRGFHVERIHLELIGLCGDCAKKHAATERKGP